MKRVAMIGVGKLGQDCAEVMAEAGHNVIGYDVVSRNPAFVMANSIEDAVKDRDLIFIAAPTAHDPIYGGETPTSHLPNKDFDYSIVTGILNEVNKHVNKTQLVVLISTVLPGTVRRYLEPCITNARFIYNPYLIAMGTVKWDMVNPEMVIIGTENGEVTGDASELIDFYKGFMQNNPRYEVGTWDEAESIKIFYNTFISTKVALVNMIQDVSETNGNINVDIVTNALAKSTYRITGSAYMKAGMGDGGACHPRDNIALRYLAENLNLGYDLFDSIMKAREVQAERLAKRCLRNGTNVTIIGKAYKPGVPYTNGSSSMLVGHYIEQLGGNVNYYDPNTGDLDLKLEWSEVYLIGYWSNNSNVLPKLPQFATIIDPWRQLNVEQLHAGYILYGNTRTKQTQLTSLKHLLNDETYPKYAFSQIIPNVDLNDIFVIDLLQFWRGKPHPPMEEYVDFVKEHLALGKKTMIVNSMGECLMQDATVFAHNLIKLIPELKQVNLYFMTGSLSAELYSQLADKMNWEHRYKIITPNNFEIQMLNLIGTTNHYGIQYTTSVKEKKFVCLNKIERGHRVRLISEIIKNNLLDVSYCSFYSNRRDSNWITEFTSLFPNEVDINQILIENKNIFPIRLNADERPNPIELLPTDLRLYENSYFSLVTETNYYKSSIGSYRGFYRNVSNIGTFVTEKTYKPIAAKHPFIITATPKFLEFLRKSGYRTFHPYIDESYDLIENDDERMDAIIKEVLRLCAFTDEEWIIWQTNVQPIVEHNFNILTQKKLLDLNNLGE